MQLAAAIGRTPSSVSMKLNNFTSLDPKEHERGIAGLQGASSQDRAIWEEFHTNPEAVAAESVVCGGTRKTADVLRDGRWRDDG